MMRGQPRPPSAAVQTNKFTFPTAAQSTFAPPSIDRLSRSHLSIFLQRNLFKDEIWRLHASTNREQAVAKHGALRAATTLFGSPRGSSAETLPLNGFHPRDDRQ